jgi:hypothetical protein
VVEVDGNRNGITILPIGTDANNEAYDMKVIAWRKFTAAPSTTPVYVPVTIFTATCTLGAATGVSGSDLGNDNVFADTITSTAGTGLKDIVTWADDNIASVVLDVVGATQIEINGDRDTAAAYNFLYVLW